MTGQCPLCPSPRTSFNFLDWVDTNLAGDNTDDVVVVLHHDDYIDHSLCRMHKHSSGAVRESRWPFWAVRPNEPHGFRGRKATLNRALVSACP